MDMVRDLYDNEVMPVIVCIAKREEDYIEEFVKYHLAIGFKHIYIYDNEDEPKYDKLLANYSKSITFIHIPGNNYGTPVQYVALQHFVKTFLFTQNITHVAHIDIDEYIVLKKHSNITEFINEYIVGDCQGIGMNWRFFGSSGKTEKTDEPVTKRFTMCGKDGNIHIKTLFKKDYFRGYKTCHDIVLSQGYVKNTKGDVINGPFNDKIDFSVIQLNHYKCKTLQEYRYIRGRGRADFNEQYNKQNPQNIDEDFKQYDINEVEDLTAHSIYDNLL